MEEKTGDEILKKKDQDSKIMRSLKGQVKDWDLILRTVSYTAAAAKSLQSCPTV